MTDFKVKPTKAGSSIGVAVARGVDDAIRKAISIISEVKKFQYYLSELSWDRKDILNLLNSCRLQGIDTEVLIEVFLEGGSEFTAIVIDVGTATDCQPVVLLPTEVGSLSRN